MSSKKGFTLVELLGVLVVLGLISVIIVPKVIDSITTSKESAYQTQVETIENAAKKYGISNDLLYPKEGEKKYIAVKDLIAVGELSDKEIINPKTGNKMNGYVLVEYNSGYQQYEYTYVEEIDENTLGAMGPTYEVKDPDKWTTSKNVTIIYPKGNGKYEYEFIFKGIVEIGGQEYNYTEQDWKDAKKWIATPELRKNITFKTKGSLIARVKNKDEYIYGSTLEIEKIDNTAPSAALGYDKNTLTTNKINLVATCTDDESGISKYLFKLGNGNWIDNGTSNKYTFSNLNDSTSYDFSVECINGVGMTSQSTLNSTTSEIGAPTFIVSNPGKWETNKNVTISYPANYTRYEFNIIDGTATRNGQELTPGTWYIASSLEEVVNFTTEGTIVARVYDGTNLKYAVNQAITYVDPTKPTCEILLTGGTLGTNGYYTVAPKVQFKTSIAGGSGIYFGQSKTNSPVYDNSVTKNNFGLINITDVNSDGNNTYYGFVKTGVIDKNVTSTCSKTFKVDTTKPVVAINGNASVSYANSSATITIPLKVTDLTSGIDTNTFTDSDITVKVGTTTVTPTKSLKYNSVSNGVYSYTLTLSGVTGNGALNLSVGAGMVVDKAGNKNNTVSISTNVIIDNTAPTLEITGTNGTTYKKESNATITLKDTGGSGLTAGSYTIKYGWATSSQTCSNLTSSTTITVAAGATSGSVKVNVKGKTGAGKLYVCNSTSITDRAKNTLSANRVVSSNMYLDNQGPILSDITKSIKQLDSSEYKSAGLDDWTNGYTKLEWNVTEGNSGINRIEYRLNNQTTWSTGGGFTITKNGSTTKYVMEKNAQRNDVIYIRVVDNLGNVSEVKSSTLKIDTTKPTWNSGITKYNKNTSSAAYTLAGSDDWSLYATKLEWSFNESISGINRIEYRINDATTWTTGGGFTTSQDGNIYKYVMERTNKRDNLLHLRAVDNAGNVSEEKSIRLRIAYSATIPTNSLCVARTYNGSDQQITSATSGTGYTLEGYMQRTAGSHTITAKLASGYRWSDNTTGTKTFECSINKRILTVKADAKSKIYGDKDPALTYTYSNEVSGQKPNFSGALSRDAGENVGTYAIKQNTLALADSSTFLAKNYTIAYTGANLTINAKNASTFTVTLSPTSYTYDGNAKTPTVTVKDGNTTLTLNTHYTIAYKNNINAGTGTVTITGKGNYTGTKVVNFTINKRTLKVIAAAKSKIYGDKDPALTYTYSNEVSGQKPNFSGALSRDAGENVGTYAIKQNTLALADSSTFLAKNYTIAYTGANLTINAKNASTFTVTLSPTSYTYDGNAKTPTVTVKDGNTTLTLNTHYTIAYKNNINAGTGTVTITGKGNYTGTKVVNFTINKKSVAVTAASASKTYDGTTLASNGCSVSTLAPNHTVTCINSGTQTDAGSATNTLSTVVIKDANGTDATKNYTITKVNGTLTVNPKSIAVTWNSTTTFTYNGSNQGPSLFSTSLTGANSETVYIAVTNNEAKATSVGSYTAKATCVHVFKGQESKSCDNYTLTGNTKAFTINKATPTIKFATTSGSVTYHSSNGFGGNWIYSPVKVSGTVTLTSSNTNYVSIQENYVSTKVDSSTSQPAPNFTIVVNGVKATSTPIPITVKFTPDNENFETVTETYNVTVNKATPTIKFATTSGSVTYHSSNGFGGNWIYSPVKVSGTVTLTSSNTNYVSIQENYVSTKVDSSTSQPAPNFTIVVNGVKATSTPIPITVKFTPDNENFETVTETYNVTVNKATPTITLSEESAWLSGSKTFTEKANVAGKFTNTSGTTSVATVSPKSNSTAVAANTAQTVTVTGVKDGSSTITVEFEPTDTINYKTVSAKYTAKVDKTRPTITANGYAYSNQNGSHDSTTYNNTEGAIHLHSSNDATSSYTYDWNNTGINFHIAFSDSGSGIESAKWCWNDSGVYTTNTETKNCSTNVINYKQIELVGAGYRKGRFTVTDKAGNETVYNVVVKIDKTRPTITVDGYEYSNKSGTSTSTPYNETGSKIKGHSSNDATSSDTYAWNKPGINFRISFSDSNAGIKSAKWCWDTKHSTTDPGTTVFNSTSNSSCSNDIRDYKQVSLTGEGYRRGRFTVKDNAGNTTVYDVVVKIDRTGPVISIWNDNISNEIWCSHIYWVNSFNLTDKSSGISNQSKFKTNIVANTSLTIGKTKVKLVEVNYYTGTKTSTLTSFLKDTKLSAPTLNSYYYLYSSLENNHPQGVVYFNIPKGKFTDDLGNSNLDIKVQGPKFSRLATTGGCPHDS